MSYIDAKEILQELVVFIRNADVMSVTDRSVTTATATGTFSATSTLDISVSNVKNIRSITVATTVLSEYTDYTVNYNYSTTKTRISFVAAQTGAYSIPYDYGTDKIFPDYPKAEMKISNFPRVAVEILDIPSEAGGFGNVVKNDINFTVVVYSTDKEDIMDYIKAIKTSFGNSWTSFHNLGSVVRPTATGPILETEDTHGKVFQQNIDFKSLFKYESN